MKVAVIAKWTILPGKQTEAVTAINALAEKVKAAESGTLVYLPHAVNIEGYNNPVPYDGEIVFYEVYQDQDAFDVHLYGPNGKDNPSGPFTDFLKQYSHLFLCNKNDGKPYMHVEALHLLSGFIREEKPHDV